MDKVVGSSVKRIDGPKKVTGQALYAAEFRPDHLAHAVIVEATIAHGKIDSLDLSHAEKSPGVITVISRRNVPSLRYPKLGSYDSPAAENITSLWDSTIHYAGQAVAVVVAETSEQAHYAASLIKVTYVQQPHTLAMSEAEPAAILPKQSKGEKVQYKRGDFQAGLSEPGLIKIDQTYSMPVETHNPMEMAATVAQWNGDVLTVHDSTRWIDGTESTLAEVFGVSRDDVHVICPFVGGAFGSKAFRWSHTILAVLAARMTKRPVKLVLTRPQMFTWMGHRPQTTQHLILASGPDGRLTGIHHATRQATSTTSEFVVTSGGISKILYECRNVETPHKLLPLNIATPTYMRAPAETPGSFALECAMDELAVALKMEPVELRLRNYAYIDPAQGRIWSGKHLMECYVIGQEKFGWKKRLSQPRSMKDGDLLVGWGMATATYPGHRRTAAASVRLLADGTALVQSATHEIGNGAYTIFTQTAADALELPMEKVRFELGDSDFPNAPAAGGSVSTASVSEAIIKAAGAVHLKMASLATSDSKSPLKGLRTSDVRCGNGRVFLPGNLAQSVTYEELLNSAGQPWMEAESTAEEEEEKGKTVTIQSFGAHFCEVKIDPQLPEVRVTRFVSVLDAGRIINPQTSRSQVLGGVIMGIGMALHEQTIYDPATGRPVNSNLADYLLPVNADIGDIEVYFTNMPDKAINTLGCRGVGEVPMVGAAAAVVNAVYHATGRRVRDLPITPDKLL
jgi:xanthine dehydrogenase YagR molybdenum-binding subunit